MATAKRAQNYPTGYEGVHFQNPSEESIEGEESIGSDHQRSRTPELEPFIRMDEVCSEDVDILNSGNLNVEKKARQKHFDGDDSTMEESISQSKAYHTESREYDEPSEKTATKALLRRMKQKRLGSHVLDGEGAKHNQNTKRAQSKRCSDGPKGENNVVPNLSIPEFTFTTEHVTKGIRSKSKRKTSRKVFKTQEIGGPTTTTPIPEASMKTNTVRKIRIIFHSSILK